MDRRRRDIPGLLFAALFFLVLFVWATGGKFWMPAAIHFPLFHLLFAAATAVALLPPVRRGAAALWGAVVPRRDIVFPLIAFSLTLAIHLIVFQGLPHIQDSLHFRMMADQLAAGRIDHPMHPYYEFFRFLYLVPDGEKIYSLFIPGYPLFLVPFTATGLSVAANPLLTAANVALTGRLADDLFGPRVAAAAMALAVLSSFLMVMGGTGMTHPFCAFLTLAALFFFLRARREGTGRRALLLSAAAGFAIGWLLLTRPQNATFLALPLALAALFEIRRAGTVARGLALTAAFLPWAALLIGFNYTYTHDLFTLRQDTYFNYSEPNDDCFGLGLGRGCPNADWLVLPEEGLTWDHALHVTYQRLSLLIVNTFGHPLLFLLVPLLFFLRGGRPLKREIFIAAPFLASVAGYYFYYFDGNVFGPRYYYETTFPLLILAAAGLTALADRIAASARPRIGGAALGGFLFAAYLFHAVFVLPPVLSTYRDDYWGVSRALSRTVEALGIRNAVVFVQPEELIGSGFAMMRHDDWEKNDVLYVRDLGDRANSALMHYYAAKGRTFHRARYDGILTRRNPPRIEPLGQPTLPPGYIVAEMEDKRYPLRGEPDYCNEYPHRDDLYKYLSIPPPEQLGLGFSKRAFFCRFRDPGEYYTFGQQIALPGRYTIDLTGVSGPDMGRFRLFIDDAPAGSVDFTGERYDKVVRSVEAELTAGFHLLRLEPEDTARTTYFLLDFVEFIRSGGE